MNSSISSSEAEAAAAAPWMRWIAVYFATLFGVAALLFAAVVILDPYSTGRFTPLTGIEIASSARTYANAGRVRDPGFDSVLAGDSTSTRIEPDRLNALTGRRFVQLSVPGLGPDNTLTLVRTFVREHPGRTRTLAFALSSLWCQTEESELQRYPDFPGWLYEADDTQYLRNILSLDAVQAAFLRLAIRLGLARESARRDGYVTREGRGIWTPERVANLSSISRLSPPRNAETFPALARLAALVNALDPRVEVVLLWMPYHVAILPLPGSPAAAWLGKCKAAAAAIAKARPNTVMIDRMRDDEVTRNAHNFWDATHARDDVMRMLEKDIAAALPPR